MKETLYNDALRCARRFCNLADDLSGAWQFMSPTSGVAQTDWDNFGAMRAAVLIEAAEHVADWHLRMLQHDERMAQALRQIGGSKLLCTANYAGNMLRATGVLLPRSERVAR